MTANEYQKAALRTESMPNDELSRMRKSSFDQYKGTYSYVYVGEILQGVLGLSGEAGEVIDILKKALFQGHILDLDHIAKELGDVAWYLAITADAIGYDLDTIFQMNIDKLKKRYPDGFDSYRSTHRTDGDI